MDPKVKKFQTILLIILGVSLLVGLMIFSGFIKLPKRGTSAILGATGNVVVWGPFPNQALSNFFNTFNSENKNSVVSYVAVDPITYDEQLLEAFARGEVPDIVILPHTLIDRYKDKVIILNEETLPLRTFRDIYSQGAEIFRIPEGTIGVPFGVDPLVMYYNRDIMEAAGFVNPPSYWNTDFLTMTETITRKETNGLDILVSGTALGESTNIRNAIPIISTISMQLGSLMTSYRNINNNGSFEGVLDQASLLTNTPVASALEYFTNFSNPSSSNYSWNKDMPEARDAFTSERVAFYFGFASELLEIQRKNPNLNFDVVSVPQIEEINKSLTYGTFYAFAIPKIGSNSASAFTISGAIANGAYTSAFVDSLGIQSVRKDLLSFRYNDSYKQVFTTAAIVARAWVTPNPKTVERIFAEMISDVTSGRFQPARAVQNANQKISDAF